MVFRSRSNHFGHALSLVTLIFMGTLSTASIAVGAETLIGTPVPIESASASEPKPTVTEAFAEEEIAPSEKVFALPPLPEQVLQGCPVIKDMKFHHNMGTNFSPELLIPIFAIIFSIGGPLFLLALYLVLSFRNRRNREANINVNIDKLIAAGRDIPLELLRGDEPHKGDDFENRNINKGIRDICVGTAALIALTLIVNIQAGSIALILIALGISRIIVWRLSRGNKTELGQPQG